MKMFQKIDANRFGRDFVVGDIHGWLQPLQAELDAVCFDPAVDRLFAVGDLIDRGPDSAECLRLTEQPWFFSVRGNHEQILFDWLDDPESTDVDAWMRYGGKAWLGTGPAHFFVRHPELRRFAETLSGQMPWVIELSLADGRRIGIAHSSIPIGDWQDLALRLPKDEALREAILWDRPVKDPNFSTQIDGIDLTVHGHVIQPHPQRRGNGVYIDTGAALFGTALETERDPPPRITAIEVSELFAVPTHPASLVC